MSNRPNLSRMLEQLDADKKYYPAWYRSELRGKGLLPKK